MASGSSQNAWCFSGEVSASRALALLACLRALAHFGCGSLAHVTKRSSLLNIFFRYDGSRQYNNCVLCHVPFPRSGQEICTSGTFVPCQMVVRCFKYGALYSVWSKFTWRRFHRRAAVGSEDTV